jgi:hypothetical protein
MRPHLRERQQRVFAALSQALQPLQCTRFERHALEVCKKGLRGFSVSTQPSLLDQIDVCENRHGGSAESEAAFEKVVRDKQQMYERIIKLVTARGDYGITVHEVAGAFGKTPNCVSGRLTELRMQGRLKKNGERRHGAAVLILNDEVMR